MNTAVFLLIIGFAAAVWGVVAGMMIFEALRRRGEKVSFLWIRLMLPAYVHRYGKLTRRETGRPGPLFYNYIVAFNVALIAVVAGLVMMAL